MEPKEKKAFEPTGLVPRSIVRTFERFRQQLLPGSETAAIREYRISRYQVLVSARCLFALLTIPIATNWLVSNWLLSPIIEHFWNTKQNEIFLNVYQEERAFAELEFFSEKLFFESLLSNSGVNESPTLLTPSISLPKGIMSVSNVLTHRGKPSVQLLPPSGLAATPFWYASKIQLLPPMGLAQLSKPYGFYATLNKELSKPSERSMTCNNSTPTLITTSDVKEGNKKLVKCPDKNFCQVNSLKISHYEDKDLNFVNNGVIKDRYYIFQHFSHIHHAPATAEMSFGGLLPEGVESSCNETAGINIFTANAADQVPSKVVPYMDLITPSLPPAKVRGLLTLPTDMKQDFTTVQNKIFSQAKFVDSLYTEGVNLQFYKSQDYWRIPNYVMPIFSKYFIDSFPFPSFTTFLLPNRLEMPFDSEASYDHRSWLEEERAPEGVTKLGYASGEKINTLPHLPITETDHTPLLPLDENLQFPLLTSPSLLTPVGGNSWENLRSSYYPLRGSASPSGSALPDAFSMPAITPYGGQQALRLAKLPLDYTLGVQEGLDGVNKRDTLSGQLTEIVDTDSLKIKEKVQEKILELAVYYNQQTILSITNVIGDLVSLVTLGCLFIWMRPEITILKSFLIEAIYSLSDTTKSFLLILLTDLLVGFHSPRGWETALELLLKHFGLPENQDFVFLFVATFPVLLDTVFKYWIFRHLNKISPSTVATYHSMIE